MENLDSIYDDKEIEFTSYSNEILENTVLNNSTEIITVSAKPNIISGDGFCQLFCGRDCKYCKPVSRFPAEKMALDGLYSTWITDNILAMARPSNEYLQQYDIINQFKNHKIKTVINMQMFGEHSFCGFPLDPSGFSYDPKKLMDNGIDHINYPCDDFGALPVQYMFDIMKTIQHRLTVGKIAVHCHAGHGRTGMVIACYLIFNNRISGIQAINYVRGKRKGSIQNKLQADTVLSFAKYLKPLTTVFWIKSQIGSKFSIQEAVMRQKKLVHGKESYVLRYVPKIIFVCLRKLSQIGQTIENDSLFDITDAKSSSDSSIVTTPPHIDNDNYVLREHFLRWIRRIKGCFKKPLPKTYAEKILKLLKTPYENEENINKIKSDLNNDDKTWGKLYEMEDIHLHCQLILDWFDGLKFPILRIPDIEEMKITGTEDLITVLLRLETIVGKTLAMLLEFLDQFQNLSDESFWDLHGIIFSRLTQKDVNFLKNTKSSNVFRFELKSHLVQILKCIIQRRVDQN